MYHETVHTDHPSQYISAQRVMRLGDINKDKLRKRHSDSEISYSPPSPSAFLSDETRRKKTWDPVVGEYINNLPKSEKQGYLEAVKEGEEEKTKSYRTYWILLILTFLVVFGVMIKFKDAILIPLFEGLDSIKIDPSNFLHVFLFFVSSIPLYLPLPVGWIWVWVMAAGYYFGKWMWILYPLNMVFSFMSFALGKMWNKKRDEGDGEAVNNAYSKSIRYFVAIRSAFEENPSLLFFVNFNPTPAQLIPFFIGLCIPSITYTQWLIYGYPGFVLNFLTTAIVASQTNNLVDVINGESGDMQKISLGISVGFTITFMILGGVYTRRVVKRKTQALLTAAQSSYETSCESTKPSVIVDTSRRKSDPGPTPSFDENESIVRLNTHPPTEDSRSYNKV